LAVESRFEAESEGLRSIASFRLPDRFERSRSIAPEESERRRSSQTPMTGDPDVIATLREERVPETRWTSLATLVSQAQSGDREAFGRLAEQFQRTVYAVCLGRLGNPSEALELTQEVFLHALRRLDQLREPERFAGWVRKIAVRLAINRATRRVALPSVDTQLLESASGHRHDPLDELIARERATRLWEGLARLKELDRDTLVAFYIRGQSLIEIAESLDTPIGTIKRRLHVARKRLKVELEAAADDSDEWTEGVPFTLDEQDSDESFEDEFALV
jgi:RNA polymerase sigma-70 factor, ECF subfamily